jgi:N-acylneuraminate cytidylyltransferase/CMP-N,N'-diacetyllegionaminic acid synthase
MSILYLITARGGSKGVPGKNLRRIGGLTLVGWKAETAKQVITSEDRLIISTDSEGIAREAKAHQVEVPFMRPPELATDTASSADVIRHALDSLHQKFDTVVLLEPSAPFTTPEHFITALTMKEAKNAHLVVGMKHTEPHTTFIAEKPEDDFVTPIMVKMDRVGRNLRRQDLKPEWTMAGNLYVFDTAMFMKTGSIYGGARNYGLLTERWHSIEIDSMYDLEMAEYAFMKGYVEAPV